MTPPEFMSSQAETPLLDALAQQAQRSHAPFYAPGHKGGQGISPALTRWWGKAIFQADLPELPELDNLFAPEGAILAAQSLAADAFGAAETFFLANGSTCGLEAAILATCGPGDKILVPRNAHRSVFSGLVMAGARPVFLAPVPDDRWDLAWGVSPAHLAAALAQHPDVKAVLLVSPNYQGICSDVAALRSQVHQHAAVLIVDEAHGPHLGFHPDLPPAALSAGADLVVQSTHKVLSALTQAAMLHVQGDRVDRDRLRQALQLTQSTSPSYLLLASLDAARQQMALQGQALLQNTLTLAQHICSGLQTGPTPVLTAIAPPFQRDPTRLTVDVSALGITGFAADSYLHGRGVTAELPTLHQLTFIVSLGNTPADGDRLIAGLHNLARAADTLSASSPPPLPRPSSQAAAITEPPLSPREAFWGRHRTVSWQAAVGHPSADGLCPYPPGIPVLLPGELITAAAIAELQTLHAAGSVITGGVDPQIQKLRIVETA